MNASRNTKQKQIILDAVRGLNHPSATEVYRTVHAGYPSISRGTVFRVLRGYANEGVLRSVRLSDSDEIFDVTLKNHYHVRCRKCGKVRDVNLEYVEGLEARLSDEAFEIEGHDIVFFGVCADCKNKKENQS